MLRWAEPLRGAARDIEAQAAVAVGRDKVYSFGGRKFYIDYSDDEMEDGSEESLTSDQMDVHIFNMVALRWIKLPAVMTETGQRPFEVPSARILHTAALMEDTVYVCGGIPSYSEWDESRNMLYGFNIDTHTWSRPEVRGTVPTDMYNHSACVLGKVMYVYGAWYVDRGNYDFISYADMYKLDTSTMVWGLITTGGPKPPVSVCQSATVIGTKVFLFGGGPSQHCSPSTLRQHYNLRVFDTEANSWLSSSPCAQPHPEGREDHSAFTYDGELYIFAGTARYSHRFLNDMWKFNPDTFSWKKVEPKEKQPSQRLGMGFCMVGDRMVLFGGMLVDDSRPCDDLLILDLSPSLKTLCKLAVIQCNLEQAELPHDIRWELAAMTRP